MLGHGADVSIMAKKYNKNEDDILDFSSNINPIMPSKMNECVLDGLKRANKYPDISYKDLRNCVGKYLNVDSDYIIPGNGASEIIYLFMKVLNKKRIGIFNPTFSEYERASKLSSIDIVDLYYEEDFSIDIDKLKRSIDKVDVVFICNPNNPSGSILNLEEILEILKSENKTLLVDETFMEFIYDEENYSLMKYIDECKNLFIIKAITKFFGAPGVRFGYGVCSDKTLVESIWSIKEPWTVNVFAESICKNIFEDKDYIKESKIYFNDEINRMIESLGKIKGITAFKSRVNFILLKLKDISSSKLKEELFIKENILIRDASNFKNLNNNYVRVAVKSKKENDILINSLRNILGEE